MCLSLSLNSLFLFLSDQQHHQWRKKKQLAGGYVAPGLARHLTSGGRIGQSGNTSDSGSEHGGDAIEGEDEDAIIDPLCTASDDDEEVTEVCVAGPGFSAMGRKVHGTYVFFQRPELAPQVPIADPIQRVSRLALKRSQHVTLL